MKGISTLTVFQALMAVISAILLSQMSWIGRQGINFIYKEYAILKVWWQVALVLFFVQFFLILLLLVIKWINNKAGIITAIICLLLGIAGTYYTYIDFTTTSHKMMGIKFHSGGYLFWFSWAITCFYFILVPFKRKIEKVAINYPSNIKAKERVQNINQNNAEENIKQE